MPFSVLFKSPIPFAAIADTVGEVDVVDIVSAASCDGGDVFDGAAHWVARGFRTRHGGTVTAQGCRTAGRSDLSRTAGSLQSELTSWPHPYSQDRSSTHVPHEPASSDLSLKSRQSSDSCGDGEIRTPEGLPPQPP